MTVRLIVFNKNGEKKAHQLSLHHKISGAPELKLVMATNTEYFEPWLFYFLREHGAYIETTDPEVVCAALNLPAGEDGIIKVKS